MSIRNSACAEWDHLAFAIYTFGILSATKELGLYYINLNGDLRN